MKRILCLFLIVILLSVGLTGCSGGAYTKPIEAAIQLTYYGNSDYLSAAFPEEYIEWYEDNYSWAVFDEYCEDWGSKDFIVENFGNDYDVSYEIIDKVKVDKVEFQALKDYMSEEYGIHASDFKKAYKFDIVFLIESPERTYDNNVYEMYSVKIRDSWYLVNRYGTSYEFTCDAY